jgi:hypothetical protein
VHWVGENEETATPDLYSSSEVRARHEERDPWQGNRHSVAAAKSPSAAVPRWTTELTNGPHRVSGWHAASESVCPRGPHVSDRLGCWATRKGSPKWADERFGPKRR